MSIDLSKARDIFLAAVDQVDDGARSVFLDVACGADEELRRHLDVLLGAHGQTGSFLDRGAVAVIAADSRLAITPGSTIGSYRILEELGEGGFGVVFLAEQEKPVRRRVALKVIKPGMDTREVIARFEAERQALALMDHPNIAKVFEAGATATGRPYFVMELVQGVPITEYCDQCQLPMRERLELFVTVCQAVQHAHQKGIIHRDLKPTNVLVAIQDGQPAPKIIDFGVAKAIGEQSLTERTLTTAFAQMIGSPLYMSPEQAELSPLGVDTRSDIYSLGVMLYELLTGATPFDKDRLHEASYDELRRIIREEEPPRPSARLSSLSLQERAGVRETANQATTIAEHRRTDPRRLIQTVRGELDWIVMKCLDKDRTRRYDAVVGLAEDIGRYLSDEPVHAGEPTRIHRTKKFIRRNRLAVSMVGGVVALIVAAVGTLALTNARIRRESDARAAALKAKEASLATTRLTLQQLMAFEAEFADRVTEIPGGESLYRAMKEGTLRYLEPILKRAEIDRETDYETFVVLETVADIQLELGRDDDARRTAQRCVDIVQKRFDAEPDNLVCLRDLGRAMDCMVRVMHRQLTSENRAEFVAYCNELLELKRELGRREPDRLPPTAYLFRTLGDIALYGDGDKEAAKRLYREGVAYRQRLLGERESSGGVDGEYACWMAIRLGQLLHEDSPTSVDEAASLFDQALHWAQSALKSRPAQSMRFMASTAEFELGVCRFEQHRADQAILLVQHAAAELSRLSLDFPTDAQYLRSARLAYGTLARQLQQFGRGDGAAQAARHMAEWLEGIARQGPTDPNVQREFDRAQIDVAELLRATSQELDVAPDQ